jgi:hypothetical protein
MICQACQRPVGVASPRAFLEADRGADRVATRHADRRALQRLLEPGGILQHAVGRDHGADVGSDVQRQASSVRRPAPWSATTARSGGMPSTRHRTRSPTCARTGVVARNS